MDSLNGIIISSRHDLYPGLLEEIHELAQENKIRITEEIIFSGYPHPSTYAPKIIIESLLESTDASEDATVGFDVIIIPTTLKPRQYKNLTDLLEDQDHVEIIDRVNLLLRIFESRATTIEAQMEVTLANLKYMRPKLLLTLKKALLKERAGFYSRGEMEKEELVRDIDTRITTLERQLKDRYKKALRDMQETRKRRGIPLIPILGFYSSGKTTLFNQLTQAKQPVGKEPFVTMAAKIKRSTVLPVPFDFADTVGITLLPLQVLEAFHITFDPVLQERVGLITLDASRDLDRLQEEIILINKNLRSITNIPVKYQDSRSEDEFSLAIILTKTDLATNTESLKTEITSFMKDNDLGANPPLLTYSNQFTPEQLHEFYAQLSAVLHSWFKKDLFAGELSPVTESVASKLYDFGNVDEKWYDANGVLHMRGMFHRSILQQLGLLQPSM